MKSYKEQLEEYGYGSDDLYMPQEMDIAFVGIAETDWHYGRPVYDNSKLDDIVIPTFPTGMKEPIFIDYGYKNGDVDVTFSPSELDKAIIGVSNEGQAVYDHQMLTEAMMDAEDWNYDEAEDWISFNTLRDYSYGNSGPIVISDVNYMLDNLY